MLTPRPALLTAAKTLIVARIYSNMIRPEVEAMQAAEILKNPYHYSKKWADRLGLTMETDRITNPRHIHRSTEEEQDAFYQRMHKRHIAAGFKVEAGVCPLSTAETNAILAQRAFVDLTEELTPGLSPSIFNYYGEHYEKYTEVCLQYVCQFIPLNRQIV